ncbi:MAG: DUF342 domain-containing protein [Calditrichaeota bacterium]|nr:MAG: DUF342 domain-containing protein [Calditrichota bacterium]MBL1203976.1 DUF342 domain-containing protein [Calditrichota bacterium]NOG43807.1 DUF342 domain-containing protein [Calditrichota bacterium]
MSKKRIELNNGLLLATELWDGKLILGEIRYGTAKKSEMRPAMLKKGYRFGLLDSSFDLLESGQKGQVPIALAYLDKDPGKPWFHFEDALNDDNFNSWLKSGSFDSIDFSYPVKAGERLLSLSQTPFSYLRHPNGEKQFLAEISDDNIGLYAGENTTLNAQNNAIESEVDGYAHRTIYGTVSVYPLKDVKNIGKMHGRVEFDNALEVEQDIRSESIVTLPSNLMVNGLIRSANIRVGGNITCHFGFDNMQKLEMARIYAGQSIFTNQIIGYPVWAGMYVIVQQSIERSTIQCMNSLVSPLISASEIRVGSKIYTRNIDKSSQIFLGPNYVVDPNLKNIKNYHKQHERKLFDLYLDLEDQQRELEFTKKKALGHLAKLNKMAKASISSDVLLNRFFVNMQDLHEKYNATLEKCDRTLSIFEDEKKQLSFYETHTRDDKNPEIIVTGKISSGCVIHAPHQTLRIRESLNHVSIRLVEENGTLEVNSL